MIPYVRHHIISIISIFILLLTIIPFYSKPSILRSAPSLSRLLPTRFQSHSTQSPFIPAFSRPMSALAIPNVGDVIHGFKVNGVKIVDHLDVTAISLQHLKTKAGYLHLVRDDPNNVFAVAFKTLSDDKRGVPHVLEHSVLCGSKNYPVHDPFFRMLSRSLFTYMNALTGMDYTSYPISSISSKGFSDLVGVYLDSIYFPLLRPSDFGKESWSLAPVADAKENPDSTVSILDKLQIKGVVYNEMKGHLGSADYLFYMEMMQTLFPNNNLSGGDPLHIPEMTHDQLKKFHKDHYHPSNSRIYTYGNRPLEENLKQIGQVLDQFEYRDINIPNMELLKLDQRIEKSAIGPLDTMLDPASQHAIALTWHAGSVEDNHESFALQVLVSLLSDGYSAPLYNALIESGLGQQYSSFDGYHEMATTATITFGVSGAKIDDIAKVENVIRETLVKAAQDGFEADKITGVLHQIELRSRNKRAGFGMQLRNRLMSPWLRGIDPVGGPQLKELLDEFSDRVSKGNYLGELIRKYLLSDNVLVFTMDPSPSYRKEWDDKEKASIEATFKKFAAGYKSEEEAYQAVVEINAKMDKEKDEHKHEDVSSLPTLGMSDLPLDPPNLREVKRESVDGYDIRSRETGTSGITYYRVLNPIKGLTSDLRKLIPLFTDAVFRLDTKDLTIKELETKQRLYTGSNSMSYLSTTSATDTQTVEETFLYSGHALDKNVPKSLELLLTTLRDANFDSPDAEKKVMELIKSSSASSTSSATHSGHVFAHSLAQSRISYPAHINEEISGVTQLQLMSDLSQMESIGDVMEKLKTIQRLVMSNFGNIRVLVTADPSAIDAGKAAVLEFLNKFSPIPSDLSLPGDPPFVPAAGKDYIVFPASTSFASTATSTVPYTHEDSAKLAILSQFVSAKHLLHLIRIMGSAYGGGSFVRTRDGGYSTYSYRDPTPLRSIKAFNESPKWVIDRDITETDLTEAKLALLSSVDAPISASDEGVSQFIHEHSDDIVRAHRKQCFETSISDLKDVAARYLLGNEGLSICILGPEKSMPEDKTGWNVVEMKLGPEKEKATASGN